jgi:tetratricopeptide (TPR) repeat protein
MFRMKNINSSIRHRVLRLTALAVCICSAVFIFSPYSFAQQDNKLKNAQRLFQHENYEEAVGLLIELKAEQPQSSEVAYLLGMTYKRMQDYAQAKKYLEEAVSFTPGVKSALPELIDLLYQMNILEEAKKWVSKAQDEAVAPAQTAFLKGLILLKEGADLESAIKSFEQAESLDPAMAPSVKYQKGLVYLQLKDFARARKFFREVIARDASSDLARFAKEYLGILDKKQEAARPLRGYVGYSTQYDTNVIFAPNNEDLIHDVSNKDDWRHVFSGNVEYNFKPVKDFGVRSGLTFYGTKQNDIGFYDMMSYDFLVQPAFYPGKAMVAFPMHYNYVSINERKYLGVMGFGILNNLMLGKFHMLQFQGNYDVKDYFWGDSRGDDDKDGCEYGLGAGWYRFLGKDRKGFINLKYAINNEETRGNNGKYFGNRFTFTSVTPFMEKFKWSLVGDYMRKNFHKQHTTYNKRRHDDVYTVSNFLSYDIMRNTEINMQYTFTYSGSSLGVYKYRKNVFGLGVRYRF